MLYLTDFYQSLFLDLTLVVLIVMISNSTVHGYVGVISNQRLTKTKSFLYLLIDSYCTILCLVLGKCYCVFC